jgi:hypothetical protein
VGERLRVVDECRRAADARSNGRGGLKVGFPEPPFREVDERGFFAGHEAVGYGHERE